MKILNTWVGAYDSHEWVDNFTNKPVLTFPLIEVLYTLAYNSGINPMELEDGSKINFMIDYEKATYTKKG